jgi:hypothetical protein
MVCKLKRRLEQKTIRNLKEASNSMTQAMTVMPATSNIKDASKIMTARNNRNAINSRNESKQYGRHQKQGCLQKQCSRQQHGGRPTASETMGTSKRQQQKGDLKKTRMPDIVETS